MTFVYFIKSFAINNKTSNKKVNVGLPFTNCFEHYN